MSCTVPLCILAYTSAAPPTPLRTSAESRMRFLTCDDFHWPSTGEPQKGIQAWNQLKVTLRSLLGDLRVTFCAFPFCGSPLRGQRDLPRRLGRGQCILYVYYMCVYKYVYIYIYTYIHILIIIIIIIIIIIYIYICIYVYILVIHGNSNSNSNSSSNSNSNTRPTGARRPETPRGGPLGGLATARWGCKGQFLGLCKVVSVTLVSIKCVWTLYRPGQVVKVVRGFPSGLETMSGNLGGSGGVLRSPRLKSIGREVARRLPARGVGTRGGRRRSAGKVPLVNFHGRTWATCGQNMASYGNMWRHTIWQTMATRASLK